MMDRNARFFYKEALCLGLPVKYHADYNYLELSLGKKNYHFYRTITPLNEGASIYLCKNKFTANKILEHAGFPVAKAVSITLDAYRKQPLNDLIQGLHFPLVAKPQYDSSRGTDVLCNIKDMDTLKKHIEHIFSTKSAVQIEEFHSGLKEYRVMVLKNRVIGVVERYAAQVIGDGIHSIEELIALRNEERMRLSNEYTISPICVDQEYEQCIKEQGLTLQSIPQKNEKIQLCHTVNTGRGGDIISIGKRIHRKNAVKICQAVTELGLTYGGLDILCEDINTPFTPGNWLIIEVNYNPDTTIHQIPNLGEQANVSKKILMSLILRHPFAYLYHLCIHPWKSFFIKGGLCISILLVLVYSV